MIVRILATAAALALAAGAFFGAAPTPAGPLDPLGILFLALGGVVWFGWEIIGEGFSYGAGPGPELPLLARFGPVFIKGITSAWHTTHRPRTGSEN
jgi:hypothetical protein